MRLHSRLGCLLLVLVLVRVLQYATEGPNDPPFLLRNVHVVRERKRLDNLGMALLVQLATKRALQVRFEIGQRPVTGHNLEQLQGVKLQRLSAE